MQLFDLFQTRTSIIKQASIPCIQQVASPDRFSFNNNIDLQLRTIELIPLVPVRGMQINDRFRLSPVNDSTPQGNLLNVDYLRVRGIIFTGDGERQRIICEIRRLFGSTVL